MPAPSRPITAAFTATFLVGVVLLVLAGATDFAVAGTGALGIVVALARSWTLRTGRAFVHGYHAGYHDAAHDELTRQPCDVIDLASRQNEQLRSLPA